MKTGQPFSTKTTPTTLPARLKTLWPFLAAALLVLAAACSPPAEDTPSEPAPAAEAPVAETTEGDGGEETPAVYTVRGELVELRVEEEARGAMIKHEAIDDFKGITGEVWGMDSMTMPFEIAGDVALDDVADGDKVRFTLRVDWEADSPQLITAIEKLPADTELEFRSAQPPASDEPSSESSEG